MDATSVFSLTINEMKSGTLVWEDFILKATKFHSQLKSTILSSTAFLDSFQKIADMATSTRGGTKDIGSALTRLCLRHRSVEARLKTYTSSIMDCLILPLQDHLEEWKKSTSQLDKDHAKEYKKLRQELKKKNIYDFSGSGTLKLRKHKNSNLGSNCTIGPNLSKSMESMETYYNDKLLLLEELEKSAVRRVLIEERNRICIFVNYIRSVVEEELAMFQEISHLKEIVDSLAKLTSEPLVLPSSCEHIISDMKINSLESTNAWSHFNNLKSTPPSSPSSFGSRKSSMCSISSFNSSSSGSTQSPNHSHYRYRSLSQPCHVSPTSYRLSSISSQDSGFISHPDYSLNAGTKVARPNVSSLSEHSSGSNSSNSGTSQIKDFNCSKDSSRQFNTFYGNSNHQYARPTLSTVNFESNLDETVHPLNSTNISNDYSESYVDRTLVNTSASLSDVQETPLLPFRENHPTSTLPTCNLPSKPQSFYYSQSSKNSYNPFLSYKEFSPVYANSNEMLLNEDMNKACSDGSITPTNAERSASPCNEFIQCYPSTIIKIDSHNSSFSTLSEQSKQIFSSTSTLNRSGKAPPLPPVRKTSSISNPNAITLGTLKNTDLSTYQDIKTLKRNMTHEIYEEIKKVTKQKQDTQKKPSSMSTSLTSLIEPIYTTLEGPLSASIHLDDLVITKDDENSSPNSDYKQAKNVFESFGSKNKVSQESNHQKQLNLTSSSIPVTPPPPCTAEAISSISHHFSDSESQPSYTQHIINRFAKSKKDFLQSLNAKLAAPQLSTQSLKKRSLSLPRSDNDDWSLRSSSFLSSSSSSHRSSFSNHADSLAQSLVKRLSGHNSAASFSLLRQKSSESSQKDSLQWWA